MTAFTPNDIEKFNSVKTVVSDDNGNSFSFIQVKQLDGHYKIFIPKSAHQAVLDQGFDFGKSDLNILSDFEFILLSKQVELNTSAVITENDYIGG